MRTVSSSIMAALVVVALFWGNCFSCPQLLLEQNAHQCCHPQKRAMSDCGTQNLQQFVKTHAAAQAPAMPVMALSTVEAPALAVDTMAPVVVEYPPPDFLSLHSVLRI